MPQLPQSGKGRDSGDNSDLMMSCLPPWVVRALAANGIDRLSEASAMTDVQLLKLRGVGQKSVKLIRTAARKAKRARSTD
jgi:DNA-directed RNA polymerase alpha subunit